MVLGGDGDDLPCVDQADLELLWVATMMPPREETCRCTVTGPETVIWVPSIRRVTCCSEVSRWLGPKSITTTVDLYGHLVPEASGRARDALDGAFAHRQ